jgi:hypothetical protein
MDDQLLQALFTEVLKVKPRPILATIGEAVSCCSSDFRQLDKERQIWAELALAALRHLVRDENAGDRPDQEDIDESVAMLKHVIQRAKSRAEHKPLFQPGTR